MPNFTSFWIYLMRLLFSLFGLIPLGPLNICVQPLFPVCPLAIVRLQVQPWVISAGSVADVVLGESVLVLPPLLRGLAAHLWDGEVLLPVVSPVQLTGRRLTRLVRA